jgi:hypothetical protein
MTTDQNVIQTSMPESQAPQPFPMQKTLPNSNGVLVLGILSIPTCICYGIVGLVLGIIALALASKSNAFLRAKPASYTINSITNMKAGKTCAIIGIVLSAIYVIFVIVYVHVLGAALSLIPWKEILENI